jgi:hypothetical protein
VGLVLLAIDAACVVLPPPPKKIGGGYAFAPQKKDRGSCVTREVFATYHSRRSRSSSQNDRTGAGRVLGKNHADTCSRSEGHQSQDARDDKLFEPDGGHGEDDDTTEFGDDTTEFDKYADYSSNEHHSDHMQRRIPRHSRLTSSCDRHVVASPRTPCFPPRLRVASNYFSHVQHVCHENTCGAGMFVYPASCPSSCPSSCPTSYHFAPHAPHVALTTMPAQLSGCHSSCSYQMGGTPPAYYTPPVTYHYRKWSARPIAQTACQRDVAAYTQMAPSYYLEGTSSCGY